MCRRQAKIFSGRFMETTEDKHNTSLPCRCSPRIIGQFWSTEPPNRFLVRLSSVFICEWRLHGCVY
uniref:Uncharacterized protein n=1 Tax=Anguilla anguilla TaxID=7936 RepID=A0A0E9T5T3_ANGAN